MQYTTRTILVGVMVIVSFSEEEDVLYRQQWTNLTGAVEPVCADFH